MNILFIGDIIGRPGRQSVKQILPDLKKELEIDFVIANGENLAGGLGMTFETYREMIEAGIDYFTSGNHIWKKSEFVPYLDDSKIKVLRPANYPENVPGRGVVEVRSAKCEVRIINLQGLVFMDEYIDNPFHKINQIIESSNHGIITIVDFHAEATSEKVSFAHYLDGKVTAVIGTHTHVQTNDGRILPKGTAYLSDVGLCGSLNSSIGDELKYSINHFLTGLPFKVEPAKEKPLIFNAVLLKIKEKTKKAQSIEPINKIID